MIQTPDLIPAIRAWLEITREQGVPAGPLMEAVYGRAATLLDRLKTEAPDDLGLALEVDPDTPDVLHAVVDLLARYPDASPRNTLELIARAFDLVAGQVWVDEVGERDGLLSRLAFLAWNQARLLVDCPASRFWQARCVDHTLAQEHNRQFISLPPSDRSPDLNRRFLSDEAVLLTACSALEQERNVAPSSARISGQYLYSWLTSIKPASPEKVELAHFLAAHVAASLVTAEYHLYNADAVTKWVELARHHIDLCRGSEPLALGLEHSRLARLYSTYSSTVEHAEACRNLVRQFESLGMREATVRTLYLHGVMLKDLGFLDQALECLKRAQARAEEWGDRLIASQSIATCAQILGSKGNYGEAMKAGSESLRLGQESGCAFVLAYAQASLAELLRDSGNLESSIDAFRGSICTLEKAEMESLAAYKRVLLAETLLMAGRAAEAGAEILVALPVIERHTLTREGVAAIAILREAIHRQRADPQALRRLREQLAFMRRGE